MLAIIGATLLLICCSLQHLPAPTTDILPSMPNYNDTTQWYVSNRHAPADIFYIISTETGDYPLANGKTSHYADTYNDSIRTYLYGEMAGVDALLSDGLNFYAPYYRQCTLQTFVSDSTTAQRLPLATSDIKRAFRHYLKHQNNQRPFILAGYSQGAMILLELLKDMDAKTYKRMIAAYAIGTSITKEKAQEIPYLIPAQRADDLGVTICYNSIEDNDATINLFDHNTIAINPVNWQPNQQEALLITEPSPLKPLNEQQKDTMTVRLDTKTNYLIVKGFTADDYILPLIGKKGNLHSREIWLYRQQLRENIQLRTTRFLEQRK